MSIAIKKPYIACVSGKAVNISPLANISSSSATAPTLPAAAIPCPIPDPKPAIPIATPAPIAANAVPNTTSTILFTSNFSMLSFCTEGLEFVTSTYVKL